MRQTFSEPGWKAPLQMSSASKTLALLTHFSPARPEIGLSQLCRLAGRDKATTYRHLQALEGAGLVEQNALTKHYRLGPAIMQLAQTREATVPRKAGARAALSALAEATGETAHVSVLSGAKVYALASCESPRHGTRAIIDITTFPLHATASGIIALAFGPADLIDVATENLDPFTPDTVQTADDLARLVETARATGFGRANGTFEPEIHSLSAPVFDQTGMFAGAVSVASVATRFTPELEQTVIRNLIVASGEVTRNWGGILPADIAAIWAELIPDLQTADPAP